MDTIIWTRVFTLFFILLLITIDYSQINLYQRLFSFQKVNRSIYEILSHNSRAIKEGQIYRLFTYSLLHRNLFHLLGNIVRLLYINPIVTKKLGYTKTSIIFVLSVIAGGVFQLICNCAGGIEASSGIYGLIGCIFVIYKLEKIIEKKNHMF